DQTRINPGDFITVQQGQAGLLFAGASNGTITAVSALNDTPDGAGTAATTLDFSAPQPPVFSFSAADYVVAENSNAVRIIVRKHGGGAASVSVATADALAVAYDLDTDTGDYYSIGTSTLSFPSGPASKSFLVFVNNDSQYEGDESFWVMLTNATAGAQIAYPSAALVLILDDEPFGPTESFTTNHIPEQISSSDMRGGLQVTLQPSFGQWR